MPQRLNFIHVFIFLFIGCSHDRYELNLPKVHAENLKFPPEIYTEIPGNPSPALSGKGRELVLVKINNGCYTWIDATVENGAPFDYKRKLYGKGNQLMADEEAFPSLARKGLHAEKELFNTKIITGRSVSQITMDGRPWGSSGVGFMAEDETIMSVIMADNRTVTNLGLTHPDLARPLFHLWNVSRAFEDLGIDQVSGNPLQLSALIYNGHRVKIKITGSRGWQESIFNDEILGTGHIEIWRDLNTEELAFLRQHYGKLSQDQLEQLQHSLSYIHTGEMVFFYINRYGFYEGHTEYRADPVTVALVFGLSSIEKVHHTTGGDLYGYFASHFTKNPE